MKLVHLRDFHKENNLKYEPCVMALGFYDGVHLGHQHIINTAKEIANKKQIPLAVMTFSPHPREVMGRKEQTGTHLTPLNKKAEIMKKLGVDVLYVVKFDKEFGSLSPQCFVEKYLIALNVKHAVAGFDFTYGYKGLGDMKQLSGFGKGHFDVTTISKIERSSKKIGSTLIRELVSTGDVDQIPNYLGDYYKISGKVTKLLATNDTKEQNAFIVQYERDFILPKPGKYEIVFEVENLSYQGCCYHQIDIQDTIGNAKVLLIDEPGDILGKQFEVKWLKTL